MAGSSEARPPRAVVPTLVKLPPMMSRDPSNRTDITPAVMAAGLKPATRLPSLTLSSNRLGTEAPLNVVNLPPTYTVPATGPGNSASTSPLRLGAKVVLTAPVVAWNAISRFRVYVVVLA